MMQARLCRLRGFPGGQLKQRQLVVLRAEAEKDRATLAVFICLALHIEEEGTCFPSVSLICKETGYNRDTVFDALGKLEFRGYIARKQKTDSATRKFKSNVYQLFPKAVRRRG